MRVRISKASTGAHAGRELLRLTGEASEARTGEQAYTLMYEASEVQFRFFIDTTGLNEIMEKSPATHVLLRAARTGRLAR